MTPIDDPRPFAEVLRDFKKRHSLTDDALADFFQVSPMNIALWLAGNGIPQYEPHPRSQMAIKDKESGL